MSNAFREPGFFTLRIYGIWRRAVFLIIAGGPLLVTGAWLLNDFKAAAIAQIYQDADGLRAALQLSPGNPELLHGLARIYMYDPEELDPDQAELLLEAAIRRSPYDASLWVDYGRLLDRQEKIVDAERACRVAVALAPHYFQPRFILANLLLNSGNFRAAYADLAELIERNPDAQANIFELVWRSSGESVRDLISFVGTVKSPAAKAAAAKFLVEQRQFSGAITMWKALASTELYPSTGWRLLDELLRAGEWRLAKSVWLGWASPDASKPLLWNGDFELPFTQEAVDWRAESSNEVRVSREEAVAHGGTHALALEFPGDSRVHFAGVTHYLPVEPSTRYQLSFFHKSAALTADSGLIVKVQDPTSTSHSWWVSRPIEPGSDWKRQSLSFTTDRSARWLLLSIERLPSADLIDYVSGRVWLDDFSLTPLGSTP